jgi:cytochrome c oxidase subunit IV
MKAFFEDPALLVGLPLLLLGAFGLLLAFSAMAIPDPNAPHAVSGHRGHPNEAEYVKVGLFLGIVTTIEVAIYYVDIPRNLFIMMLIVLSATKFAVVVMWFMHLRFDSKLFTTAFVTGLVAASAVFTVVLVTLGASIV